MGLQEASRSINLVVQTESHRAVPGGVGSVKAIGNYAGVNYTNHIVC